MQQLNSKIESLTSTVMTHEHQCKLEAIQLERLQGSATIDMNVKASTQLIEMVKGDRFYPLTRAAFWQFAGHGANYISAMPMAIPRQPYGAKAPLAALARARLKRVITKEKSDMSNNGSVSEPSDVEIILAGCKETLDSTDTVPDSLSKKTIVTFLTSDLASQYHSIDPRIRHVSHFDTWPKAIARNNTLVEPTETRMFERKGRFIHQEILNTRSSDPNRMFDNSLKVAGNSIKTSIFTNFTTYYDCTFMLKSIQTMFATAGVKIEYEFQIPKEVQQG